MTTGHRMVLAVVVAAAAAACRAGGATVPCCIDLLAAVPGADIRPINRAPDAVQVLPVSMAGDARPGLSVQVPSRLTIPVPVPTRAVFTTALALSGPVDQVPPDSGVAFSVGISDGRTYERLFERAVLARDPRTWQPVRVDLRGYAGWQWSLFYRPSSRAWQLTLNAYPQGAGSERLRAVWAQPAISGDAQ